MNYLYFALAIFAALIGTLYAWRFLMFAAKKAYFQTLFAAYRYAAIGAALLAAAAWAYAAVKRECVQ